MCCYAAAFFLLLSASLRQTGGTLVYVVDDPYIHAAMARNLVRHHVWGVTRYEFSSSSSSPAYTLLLAGLFAMAGDRIWIPLALNFTAGLLALACAWRLLRARMPDPRMLLAALLSICFITPLAPIAFAGMEHTLHILLAILFLGMAAATFDSGRAPSAALLAVTALLPLVRMESFAMIGCTVLALFLSSRWKHALPLLAAAVVPAGALSALYVARGWAWLPNSILLKAYVPPGQFGLYARLTGVLNRLMIFMNKKPHMVVLGVLLALAFFAGRKLLHAHKSVALAAVVTVSIAADLVFGGSGWYYRYEAYLVASALFVLFYTLPDLLRVVERPRQVSAMLLAALLFCPPLIARAITVHRGVAPASRAVYEQQYQMARFVKRFYGGTAVAANDIGAINYYSDIRCVDLFGLANMEIFHAKRTRELSPRIIQSVTQKSGARIAILYDLWFPPGQLIPSGWTRVERWRIHDAGYVGSDTVSFYAVEPEEQEALRRHLADFAASLPAGVERIAN